MNILLTGSNGFIGRNIATMLCNDYNVFGIDRSESNTSSANIKYQKIDLSDKAELASLFESFKPEIVVNCAAAISSDSLDPSLIDSNVRGLENMMDLSIKIGVKQFIQFSSQPIIGIPTTLPVTEEHAVYPRTVYHLTKYFGEILLEHSPLKSVNLRLTSPVGAGMPKNKILPFFIQQALNNNEITLLGKGERVQNYVNVKDIAMAVKLAIEKEAEGIFNIASYESISNYSLAQKCVKLLGSDSKISFKGEDAEEDMKWIISIEKASEAFGYNPQYSIEDSILEIASELK